MGERFEVGIGGFWVSRIELADIEWTLTECSEAHIEVNGVEES